MLSGFYLPGVIFGVEWGGMLDLASGCWSNERTNERNVSMISCVVLLVTPRPLWTTCVG